MIADNIMLDLRDIVSTTMNSNGHAEIEIDPKHGYYHIAKILVSALCDMANITDDQQRSDALALFTALDGGRLGITVWKLNINR